MKKYLLFLAVLMFTFIGALLVSCSSDDDDSWSTKDHDGTLYGEWIAYNDGKKHVHDYYYFYSDGTGIHGSYESDIDLVNEDDDIKWYTVDNKYLYIDGKKYSYSCDGSSLCIGNKTYYAR